MEAKNNYALCKGKDLETTTSSFKVENSDRFKELEVISCGMEDLKPGDVIVVPIAAIEEMELDGVSYQITKVGNVILVK